MSHEARRGALYNYLNLLLIAVAGVFLTPFVVHHLGASQYGLYTLVGAMIPYLMLLDMGMGKTITRYVAHYRAHNDAESEARFLTTTIGFYAIITIILLAIGACIYGYSEKIWSSSFTPEELSCVREMILVITVAHAIIIPGNALTAICNGCGLFAFPRAVLPIKYLIRVACVIALLLCGYKALALIALEMVLNIGIVIATFIYVRRHIGRKHIFARHSLDFRPILQYTGWIAIYATTCALQWNAAQIVAGMRLDSTTVGSVGIGILIGNMYGYFAETINRMTLPRASRIIKEDASSEAITAGMIGIGRLIAIVQMGVLSAFVIFGHTFIQLWVGEQYSEAYIIALIMMASWMVQQSQDFGNAILEAKGRVRTMAIINFICIFAGVIASYYATRYYGVVGLIGALACGTILATIASNVYYRHRLQLKTAHYFTKVYGRLACATLVCMGIFGLIREHISTSWMWLVAGIPAYIALYTTI
ncbi:MAG: polysaccharide biosynthesis C-terminal domain-containing protein, partial [Bacteroidales bacterium]|nr:polysaccharide biosynthesis C-terminal domain-containing protein [Bacteroidales bacterium]